MAAKVLLQPTTHRLERWERRTNGEHRTWHTAFCTCGWRSDEDLHQHRVEVALEVHLDCQRSAAENDKNRAELASQAEDLLVFVGECERAAAEEDRIDTITRYSR